MDHHYLLRGVSLFGSRCKIFQFVVEKKIVKNKKTLFETGLDSIILLDNRYSFIIFIIVSFWNLTKMIAITENWDILSQSIRTIWYF